MDLTIQIKIALKFNFKCIEFFTIFIVKEVIMESSETSSDTNKTVKEVRLKDLKQDDPACKLQYFLN